MINLTEQISLSPVTLEDHTRLFRLMQQIYPPAYSHLWKDQGIWYLQRVYSKENLEKEVNDPDSRYYFVNHQKQTAGIIRVLLNQPFNGGEEGKSTKLQRIYLAPSVQGKGIGRKLIHWCEKEFQEEGAVLWLDVMDSQQAVIDFYKKMGFAIAGRFRFKFPLMYENLSGAYVMFKNIK